MKLRLHPAHSPSVGTGSGAYTGSKARSWSLSSTAIEDENAVFAVAVADVAGMLAIAWVRLPRILVDLPPIFEAGLIIIEASSMMITEGDFQETTRLWTSRNCLRTAELRGKFHMFNGLCTKPQAASTVVEKGNIIEQWPASCDDVIKFWNNFESRLTRVVRVERSGAPNSPTSTAPARPTTYFEATDAGSNHITGVFHTLKWDHVTLFWQKSLQWLSSLTGSFLSGKAAGFANHPQTSWCGNLGEAPWWANEATNIVSVYTTKGQECCLKRNRLLLKKEIAMAGTPA